MTTQPEPGRIVSIVDEHATFEAGVVAPIPKNQSFGEWVVFLIVVGMFGAIGVIVVLKAYHLFTVDEPVYVVPVETHDPINTVPRR